MQGEIITIGNELTSGRAVDLNARYVAERLSGRGLVVNRITTVGDDPQWVSKAIRDALGDAPDFIVVTGGLGSTEDDMTNQIVADTLNRPLRLHAEKFRQIREHVEAMGVRMTPSYEKMAWMPRDSEVLSPTEEMCGFSLKEGKATLYFLPGVPEQMRHLLEEYVLPHLLSCQASTPVSRYRVLKIYGLSEPEISEILKRVKRRDPGLFVGYYPHFPENHLSLGMQGPEEQAVDREMENMEAEIRTLMGEYVFGSDEETMSGVVGRLLEERGLSLAIAESCTGGLIGNLVTNNPGSSSYFLGGVVSYSNQAKIDLLRVDPDLLKSHGAVSEPIARGMADGARAALQSDVALAVTGIAGPEGGSREKPVGTVHIGLATPSGTFAGRYLFRGKRRQIKLNAAMMALDWARRYLCGYSFLPGL
jgi:nicotinamide-nucleotide amidase